MPQPCHLLRRRCDRDSQLVSPHWSTVRSDKEHLQYLEALERLRCAPWGSNLGGHYTRCAPVGEVRLRCAALPFRRALPWLARVKVTPQCPSCPRPTCSMSVCALRSSFYHDKVYPKILKYFAVELDATEQFFYEHDIVTFAPAANGATIGELLWNRQHGDDDLGITCLVAHGEPAGGGNSAIAPMGGHTACAAATS